VQYAIPRAGGEARHAKGDERREGESSVFRRLTSISFLVVIAGRTCLGDSNKRTQYPHPLPQFT